ncbi:MAG: hypothetical protein EAX86_08680 [Candidatus Heimdallarchaeota archaeon]|nr:hypothetical protein [Candidatus Heimdallarchaeota archaeon]
MTKNIRKKRSPGNKLVIHKIKRRSNRSYCRICGISLRILTKSTKSRKRVDRPFGGEICHACLRTSIQSGNFE